MELTLNNPLTDEILESQSVIILTVVATAEANPDLVGYTVVIIALPEVEVSPEVGKKMVPIFIELRVLEFLFLKVTQRLENHTTVVVIKFPMKMPNSVWRT